MSKKTVLFVVHHLTIGGVQKSLVSALNYIDYESNSVTLYLRKNRLDLLPYINKNVNVVINKDNRHYYRFPRSIILQTIIFIKTLLKKDVTSTKEQLTKYIHDKQFIYERKRYFSKANYDIAIAYNEGYTSEFVMDCVSAKRKIMFFQSSTDSKHEIHKRIMPQFDLIIVEHQDIKESLLSWYSGISNNIRIIENYTDYKLIRELSKKNTLEKQTNSFILCTCSRFSTEKGIDLAVESAKQLKDRGIDFKWYLVGDGPEKESVYDMIDKYRLHNIVFLPGMQMNPYAYMASCDIYIQPSREEALSISMLESKILCVPMVSTRTAGGCAMIKDGVDGIITDINPESLAEKIESLLNDDNLRKIMKDNLLSIDYSSQEKRYKMEWKKILS